MTDLLDRIHSGEITLEEGECLFHKTIEEVHRGESDPNWASSLGFSKYEATAFCQAASLADLVTFRYEGWPDTCCRCGEPLDYEAFGWWIVHGDDGVACLKHIECPGKDVAE